MRRASLSLAPFGGQVTQLRISVGSIRGVTKNRIRELSSLSPKPCRIRYIVLLNMNTLDSVGFMSSSDRRVHFGLGQETGVASIDLRWPSGVVQTLTDVRADQILHVEEPH